MHTWQTGVWLAVTVCVFSIKMCCWLLMSCMIKVHDLNIVSLINSVLTVWWKWPQNLKDQVRFRPYLHIPPLIKWMRATVQVLYQLLYVYRNENADERWRTKMFLKSHQQYYKLYIHITLYSTFSNSIKYLVDCNYSEFSILQYSSSLNLTVP